MITNYFTRVFPSADEAAGWSRARILPMALPIPKPDTECKLPIEIDRQLQECPCAPTLVAKSLIRKCPTCHGHGWVKTDESDEHTK